MFGRLNVMAAGGVRMWAAVVACAFACIFVLVPARAYAWFNDVTESYPATQEIPIDGSVLTGADIPEGTYSITATSSSYMCKFTNVTLTSAGGELWATFTLSKAYNALYFGTAEEAAAATNADGTDYSAYYVTEPLEGYVARQFSLPIPALNYEITIATFSGGNKGIDKGLWYTRTVVFNSSAEVMRAIENASNPQPADDPGTTDDSGKDESGSRSDGASSSGKGSASGTQDGVSDSGSGDDESDSKKSAGSSKPKKTNSSGSKTTAPTSNASSGNRSNSGNGGNANSENSQDSEEKDAKPENAKKKDMTAAKNGKLGHAISFVELDDLPLGSSPTQVILVDKEAQERDEGAAVAVVVGIVLVNLVLIGAFLVMIRRVRPRRFPRMR